jgi:hypothetical protein
MLCNHAIAMARIHWSFPKVLAERSFGSDLMLILNSSILCILDSAHQVIMLYQANPHNSNAMPLQNSINPSDYHIRRYAFALSPPAPRFPAIDLRSSSCLPESTPSQNSDRISYIGLRVRHAHRHERLIIIVHRNNKLQSETNEN